MVATNATLKTNCYFFPLGSDFDFTPRTLEEMTSGLKRPFYNARYEAACALEKLGAAAAPAVPALMRSLGDSNGIVRNASIWALGSIGPAASNALPVLRTFLTHESRFTVKAAREAIERIGG